MSWNNLNYNAKSENLEIVPCPSHELRLSKERIMDKFDLNIEKKTAELEEIKAMKEYFVKNFQKHFDKQV